MSSEFCIIMPQRAAKRITAKIYIVVEIQNLEYSEMYVVFF